MPPRSRSGSGSTPDGAAKILTKPLDDAEVWRTPKQKDRGGGSGGGGGKPPKPPKKDPNFQPKAPTRMDPSGDVEADRLRLRQAVRDKIDDVSDPTNPDGWSKKQRQPCVSAVWDRESGRIYYNHNNRKDPVDPDRLDPILRRRYEDYQNRNNPNSNWKNDLEENQDMHGEPGQHSESRATNKALKDARADGREPRLEDFMVENGRVTSDSRSDHKQPMPCCANCTQMIDGVDGSSGGWDTDAHGKKTKRSGWDGS
ncbi:YwqJ-like deaminase [Glycomyces sambucus]|uniref:YwqJ-like deaminase n=1 Tax=Glycomyces sambucus TaxID=380244 RepID=A0A1G9FSH8_9ACTN|nr:YwqJ-related putative deaminase [Glycomyces sambucus]SDK91369.1 YwqJ-like deaminase [Glycomyces sambucus]